MNPARSTTAGAAYLDLQRLARDNGRPVQECFQHYVLEAFLDRLTRSPHRDQLVLKGGALLAAFGERRPTRDLDLQAQAMSNDADTILGLVIEIASVAVDDGVDFDIPSAATRVIRDEDAYSGVRVSMLAALATARLSFHVDVNVGDPIRPAPENVDLPRLLGGALNVRGYPLAMVHAEKIATAIARGTINTRWRDFMDVVMLAGRHPIGGDTLLTALRDVATHRDLDLVPLSSVLDGYGDIGQSRWAAWRRKQQVEDRTPESFDQLVANFVAFADPAVAGEVVGRTWDPNAQRWR